MRARFFFLEETAFARIARAPMYGRPGAIVTTVHWRAAAPGPSEFGVGVGVEPAPGVLPGSVNSSGGRSSKGVTPQLKS